ncbi:hypothetical protein [Treponema pedis]|uniref:Lipoprotein n=1 Tax=Treponema pedis str. T A4 TaxID=1291379 RepID=S5ZJW4_9SPIR|nr:hypothetical protein [Treponema pedis]AGT42847.1 hypothetical protein TPE_0351 [Treponema pedis str. T A4]
MKQRRAVSVLGALILAVCIAALGVSCKNKVKPETYDGNYSGTWQLEDDRVGYETYKWDGSIDKNGNFSIKFATSTINSVDAVFKVSKDGSFSGTANIDMTDYSFKGKIKEAVVSGTIFEKDKLVGKIDGKKNN